MDHIETIDRIFELRKKLRLTQKDFASRIGVDRNTLSRWENKKNIPHPIAIRKMEEMLKFRPEQQIEKRPSGRIKEVLESMQRLRELREGRNSGSEKENK